MAAEYEVLIGLNLAKTDERLEPGDLTTAIPETDAKWMLEQGVIRKVEKSDDRSPTVKTKQKEGD